MAFAMFAPGEPFYLNYGYRCAGGAAEGQLITCASTRRDAIRQSVPSLFITNSTGIRRTRMVEPYCVLAASTNATSLVTNRMEWITRRRAVTSDHGSLESWSSRRSNFDGCSSSLSASDVNRECVSYSNRPGNHSARQ